VRTQLTNPISPVVLQHAQAAAAPSKAEPKKPSAELDDEE